MTHRPIYLLVASILAVLFTTTVWMAAEPIIERNPKLPDEALSLRGLKKVRVAVDAVPEEVNFSEAQIMEILRDALDDAGIKVSDDPKLPKFVVSVAVQKDPEDPEIIAFAIVPSVYQSVTVDRLDQRLTIPTFSGMTLGVMRSNESHKHFKKQLHGCLNYLIRLIREVSDEKQQKDRTRS